MCVLEGTSTWYFIGMGRDSRKTRRIEDGSNNTFYFIESLIRSEMKLDRNEVPFVTS